MAEGSVLGKVHCRFLKEYLYFPNIKVLTKDLEALKKEVSRLLRESFKKADKVLIRAREGSSLAKVLEELNLKLIRKTAIMELENYLEVEVPKEFSFERLKDKEILIRLHDEIFSDAFLFEPLTSERAEAYVSENSKNEFYVACFKGQIVGLVALTTYDDKAVISHIGLIKNYRGRGLSKYLLNFALNRSKLLNASMVELGIDLSVL